MAYEPAEEAHEVRSSAVSDIPGVRCPSRRIGSALQLCQSRNMEARSRRYWWVNHGQTVQQEVAGGYLWSPKTEAGGVRSQFYTNMREAGPGDPVISFANAVVSSIGFVSDFAANSPKPGEFGSVGSNWSAEGWILPVSWQSVPKPIRPKDLISYIAPLLPKKYSPIKASNGNGNQKAYLTEVSDELFNVIASRTGFQAASTIAADQTLDSLLDRIDEKIQSAIQNDPSLSSTEKEQIVKARKGQGEFRARVFEIERGCRVTGIDNPSLLVASHIKSWRSCASSTERLDGYNGLLLAPHVDHLFDRGWLTFRDDGTPIVSPRLRSKDLQRLGLSDAIHGSRPFSPQHRTYLDYHRREVFMAREEHSSPSP
jgi:putative restriction endonuclease